MSKNRKSPYDIIKSRHITEKSQVLSELQHNVSNASITKCNTPKYVFIVDKSANKHEIAEAVEQIYAEKNVRVLKVNTINMKPKMRRMRGRSGLKAGFKKAVVTMEAGDKIEDNV